MLPDPLNPQRDDVFHDGTEERRIMFAGEKAVISRNLAGNDERVNLRAAVATWTPVAANGEAVVIYEWTIPRNDGTTIVGWGTHKSAGLTGRVRRMNPDGTWEYITQ